MINKIKEFFRKKPKTWFTSDLHFHHRRVIEYCSRPWKDHKEEMTNGLIKIWNSTVKPQDTVYCLGDFSLDPKWSDRIVPKLNGYKVLIPGNHDTCFSKPTQLPRYLKVWNEVHMTKELTLKNGITVLLSHLPYLTKDSLVYDDRYLDLRPKDNGLIILHGHYHSKYLKNKRCIDVGIDNDFTLLSEDRVIELINDPREFIPSRLTKKYQEGGFDSRFSSNKEI